MTKSVTGHQNETAIIPSATRIALIDAFGPAGFAMIEAAGFVPPRWVPQMADAAEVMAGIERRPGVRHAALVPNRRGLDAAVKAGVDEVAVFASTSEGFSWRNINCSIAESLELFAPATKAAEAFGIPVRGYVSCVIASPCDGPTAPAAVRDAASS